MSKLKSKSTNTESDSKESKNGRIEKDENLNLRIRKFVNRQLADSKIITFKNTHQIMVYQDGHYIKGEEYLQKKIDVDFEEEATLSSFNNFLHFIRSRTHIDRKDFSESENKINLNNGVLDIIKNERFRTGQRPQPSL
jgi:hypothetical protein